MTTAFPVFTKFATITLLAAAATFAACSTSSNKIIDPVDSCVGVGNSCTLAGSTCALDQLVTCAADANGCLVETRSDCAATGDMCDDSGADALCVASCDAPRCRDLSAGDGFCDSGTPVLCSADSAGCLVEEPAAACGDLVCDDSTPAPSCVANGSGDSCSAAFIVQHDITLAGTDIRDDFTQVESFGGMGCPVTDNGAAPVEAVFMVDLKAGKTLHLSEHGELDAVLGIIPSCAADAACSAAEGNFGAEAVGISYTAQTDETVYAYVSAFSDFSGTPPFLTDYDIRLTITECGDGVTEGPESCDDNDIDRDGCTSCRVDLGFECDNSGVSVCTGPTDLGTYAAAETIPDTTSTIALDKDGTYFYTISFTENVLLAGALDAAGGADIDIGFFDADEQLVFSSETAGGEAWNDKVLVAGTYTLLLLAYEAVPNGWALSMSTTVGPICGDGIVGIGEECDDNSIDNDGCTSCKVDIGYVCDNSSNPSVCVDACGNGEVNEGEECDDGNTSETDRCASTCLLIADVNDIDGNDSFATAQELTDGQVAHGSLDPAGTDPFDLYKFTLTQLSWVTIESYTTVDALTSNYDGAGLDATLDCGADPDLYLFDATGDPTDNATSLVSDDASGDLFCAYLGPNTSGSAVLLDAGTYYIKVNEFSGANAIANYALDFQVDAPLASGAACVPELDLCNRASLTCNPSTNICTSPIQDRGDYEQFLAGQFDLANTGLHFSPAGDSFDVVAIAATAFPDVPGTGTVATSQPTLTNDGSVIAPVGFGFPFFGTNQTSLYVNANGNLSFGSADSQQIESPTAHFAQSHLSFFFDDLRPDLAGTVSIDEFADRLTVTFNGVQASAGTIAVQVQLFASGSVVMTYLAMSATNGLVGISAGDNAGNPPAPSDFASLVASPPAAGDLVINEIMANPNLVSDTNCDTTFSSTRDEFLEIVNVSGTALDLTGVTITDNFTVRHTFGSLVLGDRQAVVVYGGGTPSCAGVFGIASSTGRLALNNGGDTLTLRNPSAVVIDAATYTSSTVGISRTRDADLVGTFVNHDTATGAVGNYSPGFRVSGQSF